MTFIRVKDKDYLIRDTNSNAIINTDIDSYHIYIENYKKKYSELQRIEKLEGDMNQIKNDLSDIKNLLRGLSNESR